MAINFPNNPLDGNTYTYEGVKYTFKDTGSGGYWYLKDLGTATAATTTDVNAGTDTTKYVTSESIKDSVYDKDYSNSYTLNDSNTVATSKAVRDAVNFVKVPTGTVVAFAGSTIPSGWLECNGSTISTSYPELRALVGTNTPDLRDRFIRGKSSSRSIRSTQSDAMQRVTGSITAVSESYLASGGATGAFYKSGSTYSGNTPANADGSNAGNVFFDNSRQARTASETRPMNMALYYIIKT